jgi:hypothetical protein
MKWIETPRTRAEIIQTIQTPLGFFTLVVLVVEGILVYMALSSQGVERTWIIIGMLFLGFLLVILVAVLAVYKPEALRGKQAELDLSCGKYGIQVESPDPSQSFTEYSSTLKILGSYKNKPPDKSLRLFTESEDRKRYWATRIVEQFDEESRKWCAHVPLAGFQGGETMYRLTIVVALVGSGTSSLWEYYNKVGNEIGRTVPLDYLPPDVRICGKVQGVRKKPG